MKGQKVPDIQGMASTPFSMTTTGTLTTNTNGAAAIIAAVRTPTAAIGIATITAATNNVASWATSNMTGSSPVANNFGRIRPVSACLDLMFISNTATDQGTITGFLTPPTSSNQTPVDVSSWETAFPYTTTVPLRAGERVLWRPEDNTDFEYTQVSVSDLNAGGTGAFSNVSPLIGASIVGAAVSTSVARYILTVNYEGIPIAAAQSFISHAASPVDVEGTAKVLQVASLLPAQQVMTAVSGIGAVAEQQLHDVISGKGPSPGGSNSTFQSILGEAEKLAPTVAKGIPYVGTAIDVGEALSHIL